MQERGTQQASNVSASNAIDLNIYKITLDQKTLSLIDSLLMEFSLIGSPSQSSSLAYSLSNRTNEMEGILKVLEWRANENITEPEFESLYNEWLKSKQFFIEAHLISYEYDQLVPKNVLISYLRRCSFPDLSTTLTQFMASLNNQLNLHLASIQKVSQEQIEASEALYMLLDDQGIGIVGLDSMIFLYMAFVKVGKLPTPTSRHQFDSEFQRFVEQIPHSNGYFSLRSIKTFLCSGFSVLEISEVIVACKEMMNEFGWNCEDLQGPGETIEAFPKLFNDVFIESMHFLHQQRVIQDEDLLRDEFLNVYNILLSEEFYNISAACNSRSYSLKIADPGRLFRALHARCISGEFYPRAVLERLQVQPLTAVFSGFVTKFEQKIAMYVTQFLNKFARHSSSTSSSTSEFSVSSSQTHYNNQPSRYSQKAPESHFQQRSILSSQRFSQQELDSQHTYLEKENYQPKINFFDEDSQIDGTFVPASTQYNTWIKGNIEQANKSQTNINKNQIRTSLDMSQRPQKNSNVISKGYGSISTQQNQFVATQKQMLFQQFTAQHHQIDKPIEYRVKLQTNDRYEIKPTVKRSKSPISNSRSGSSQSKSINGMPDKTFTKPNLSAIQSKPPTENKSHAKSYQGAIEQQQQQQQQRNINSRYPQQPQSESISRLSKQNSLRQVTPTKSVSPIKMYSNQINQPQRKPDNNKQQQTQSPFHGNRSQNQLRSSLGNRPNNSAADESIVVNRTRKQTSSIGYREHTPDKSVITQSLNFESHIKQRPSTQKLSNQHQSPYTPVNSNQQSQAQLGRSKSPQIRKVPSAQMWNKRVESFEQVMSRLTAQQGVSPMKEYTKKPFI